jgi:hypothetical protein
LQMVKFNPNLFNLDRMILSHGNVVYHFNN